MRTLSNFSSNSRSKKRKQERDINWRREQNRGSLRHCGSLSPWQDFSACSSSCWRMRRRCTWWWNCCPQRSRSHPRWLCHCQHWSHLQGCGRRCRSSHFLRSRLGHRRDRRHCRSRQRRWTAPRLWRQRGEVRARWGARSATQSPVRGRRGKGRGRWATYRCWLVQRLPHSA